MRPGLALQFEQLLHVLHVLFEHRDALVRFFERLLFGDQVFLHPSRASPGAGPARLLRFGKLELIPRPFDRRGLVFDLGRDLAARALAARIRPLRRGRNSRAQLAPVLVEIRSLRDHQALRIGLIY